SMAVVQFTVAHAQVAPTPTPTPAATNLQVGDNHATTNQSGGGKSGSSVGGQVSGVVSGGHTSVDATNTSKDSSVESGQVNGSNTSTNFTGLDAQSNGAGAAPTNIQNGDNRSLTNQTVNASSGDAVGG